MDQSIDRLMPAGEVLRQIGDVSRDTLRRWVKAGLFPEPVSTPGCGRRPYWRASDVQGFIARRDGGGDAPQQKG